MVSTSIITVILQHLCIHSIHSLPRGYDSYFIDTIDFFSVLIFIRQIWQPRPSLQWSFMKRRFWAPPSVLKFSMHSGKGPYINDVSEIFGILDPPCQQGDMLVSTKFTQPPLLWSEIGYPLPPHSTDVISVWPPMLTRIFLLSMTNLTT